jgi:hypothetical protein
MCECCRTTHSQHCRHLTHHGHMQAITLRGMVGDCTCLHWRDVLLALWRLCEKPAVCMICSLGVPILSCSLAYRQAVKTTITSTAACCSRQVRHSPCELATGPAYVTLLQRPLRHL